MMRLADCSFEAHSQVCVDAISYLCIAARKKPTSVLSLLSLIQAGFKNVISDGLLLTSLMLLQSLDGLCCDSLFYLWSSQ